MESRKQKEIQVYKLLRKIKIKNTQSLTNLSLHNYRHLHIYLFIYFLFAENKITNGRDVKRNMALKLIYVEGYI